MRQFVITLGALLLLIAKALGASPETITGTKCRTSKGEDGICVPNYQCDPEKNSLDLATFVDLRIGLCPDYLQVCCLPPEMVQKPTTELVDNTKDQKTEDLKCGYSNPGASTFRESETSNALAEFGEFPWMVALLRNTAPDDAWSQKNFLGGGSIIHPRVVITAAHKIDGLDANEIKCRAGEWDTQTDSEEYPYQERNVKKIVSHEEFFRPRNTDNIALLFLERSFAVKGAPHIGTGCLGNTMPKEGTQCYSMGWGKEFNKEGVYSNILKKIRLPIVGKDRCQNMLQNTRLGSSFRLHPSQMCAGGELNSNVCKGDGGSSLVCAVGNKKEAERFEIIGIVSSGLECERSDIPGIYVNIPYMHDWITKKMKEEGFDATSFSV